MTKLGVPQTIKEFNLWENYPVIFYLSPNLNKTKKNLILSFKLMAFEKSPKRTRALICFILRPVTFS